MADVAAPTAQQIQDALPRIKPYVRETPLIVFDHLSRKSPRQVLLKLENLQHTGSFKIRGASNCIINNMTQAKKSGVIAASAGNHAQAVAMMCHLLGIRSTIVMPSPTPPIKVQNTQRWGAEVRLEGDVYDDSFEHASKLAEEKGFLFVHPFRDTDVMAGQGTIGLELLAAPLFDGTEAVVIPIGGGGLAVGMATALRAARPDIKIYGVTPKSACATFKSFHGSGVVAEDVKYTIAEGTATKRPDAGMLRHLKDRLDDILDLSEESIAHAISVLAEHGKLVAEGSGALGLAAVIEGRIPHNRIALILSGGNIDLPTLSTVLQRGLVEQGRLVRLVITIIDRPGGLHAVTTVLAEKKGNILQVFHQRSKLQATLGEAEIEVDLETRGPEHTAEIEQALKAKGFRVQRI